MHQTCKLDLSLQMLSRSEVTNLNSKVCLPVMCLWLRGLSFLLGVCVCDCAGSWTPAYLNCVCLCMSLFLVMLMETSLLQNSFVTLSLCLMSNSSDSVLLLRCQDPYRCGISMFSWVFGCLCMELCVYRVRLGVFCILLIPAPEILVINKILVFVSFSCNKAEASGAP